MHLMGDTASQWIKWHFFEAPKNIFNGAKNILFFNMEYFSIPLLFKTYFSYWHRFHWEYPRGFSFGKYAEVFFSNLISRILGAILRTFLIIAGILAEIIILFVCFSALILWIISPFLIVAGAIFGIKLILF